MSELPTPLCDRHDRNMIREADGGLICPVQNCGRRHSPVEGYTTAGEPGSANRHPCPACGTQMQITRFTAHGPDWRCARCAA